MFSLDFCLFVGDFRPLKMRRNFVFGCVLVFVPTIENGEEFVFGCFSFFSFFSTQNPTTNNHRTGLSDISY